MIQPFKYSALSDDAQPNLLPTGFYERSLYVYLAKHLCWLALSSVVTKNETIVARQLVYDIRPEPVIFILSVLVVQGCGGVRAQAGRYRQRQSVPQRGLQTGEH